jgi:hypothetical protein
VEAGNYHNPMLLNLKEYPVRKAPHSCATTVPVDDRRLQRVFCYRIYRGLNRGCKTLSQRRANVVIP